MIKATMMMAVLIAGGPDEKKKDQGKTLTEKEKIEALIKHVEGLKDVKFVRNDTEYDAKTAGTFLRGKWDNNKDVKTAKEFIDKCATKSTTTGKDYIIRMKDGKEKKCADHLKDELKKIEKR
jgi:uncharacterized protein DUF5329